MKYDVVVIGAGHAGCEAAWASASLGCKTLLVTMNLEAVAFLACNPSIGGTAKGHLVCEVDALGGIMGRIADATALQIRMLNVGKGAAVYSLRAQTDKVKYHNTMKHTLERVENITIKQAEAISVKQTDNEERKTNGNCAIQVEFATGEVVIAKSVVVATGVYLNSRIHIGEYSAEVGPSGFAASNRLTQSLLDLGLEIRRFKTGTPPRVNSATIDFGKTIEQSGDEGIQTFSALTKRPIKNVVKCHLTYTNPHTHEVIRANLHRSPMYSGIIKSTGARYCPSIEDKVVRFADRERHQVFLEPESLSTNEIYLQGISTSLPVDVQEKFVHSIEGLEQASIMRSAYAIEYNCINSVQLYATLEYKGMSGLFFAGQINGTSGYEEAAAQGLVAGINAAKHASGSPQVVFPRTSSYIGVLIDDLVTVGTNEPYRMFTSRAEHRLSLRQDNADIRLTEIGRKIGLVDDERWKVFNKKLSNIAKVRKNLETMIPYKKVAEIFEKYNEPSPAGMTVEQIAKRNNITLKVLQQELQLFKNVPSSVLDFVTTEIKYAGYLDREQRRIHEAKRSEETLLPTNIEYAKIKGLRKEAAQKLAKIKPQNIAQAGRISGVTPADINVLLIYIKKACQRSKFALIQS